MSNICIFPECKIGQYFSEELGANIPLEKRADNFSTYKLQKEFQKCSSMLSKQTKLDEVEKVEQLPNFNGRIGKQFQTNLTKGEGQKKVDQGCCLLQRTSEFLQKKHQWKIRVEL